MTASTELSAKTTAISTSRSAASIGRALSTLTFSVVPGGRLVLHPLDLGAHAARDLERVALRLGLHLQHEAGLAVEAAVRPLVLGGERDFGELAEPHEVAVGAALDDEVAEVLLGLEADHRAQRELARPRLEPARGQLDVLAPQRVLDVGDRELARRERLAVDPDSHRVAAGALDADAGDTGHRRHAVDDVALGVVREIEHRHGIRRERERHDGVGVRVGLDDLRRISLRRQAAQDARDTVAHVVGRGVDVAVDVELDTDLRALVLAVGFELEDALDAGDRVLDDLRDLGLDDRRRRAAIGRRDRNGGAVDVGVLADRRGAAATRCRRSRAAC